MSNERVRLLAPSEMTWLSSGRPGEYAHLGLAQTELSTIVTAACGAMLDVATSSPTVEAALACPRCVATTWLRSPSDASH